MAKLRTASGDLDLGPLPPADAVRPEWWRDCSNIASLLRHLHDVEGIDVDVCIDIVSKPWNWTTEYEDFVRCLNASRKTDPPSDGRITIDEDRPEFEEDCE